MFCPREYSTPWDGELLTIEELLPQEDGDPQPSDYKTPFKEQGSYRQDCVKFMTFQGLLKDFPTVFMDWKLKKNTDLQVKILLLKC